MAKPPYRPVPKAPGWIDQVRFITFMLMQDCDYPMWVYFETSKKPAGKAVLRLLEFGFYDLVRAFFRPKGLRSARHGRKGRRGKRSRIGIPELSEIIAKRLPGYAPMRGRRVTQGVKNLWIIDTFFQRVLYHWLIIDVTADFLFEWTSGILTHEKTDCENVARMMRTDDGPPGQGLLKWQALQIRDVQYEQGVLGSTQSSCDVPAGTFFITVTLTANSQRVGGTTMNIRLRKRLGDQAILATAGSQHVPQNTDTDFVVSGMIEGPMVIGWDIYVDSGFTQNKHASVILHQMR